MRYSPSFPQFFPYSRAKPDFRAICDIKIHDIGQAPKTWEEHRNKLSSQTCGRLCDNACLFPVKNK